MSGSTAAVFRRLFLWSKMMKLSFETDEHREQRTRAFSAYLSSESLVTDSVSPYDLSGFKNSCYKILHERQLTEQTRAHFLPRISPTSCELRPKLQFINTYLMLERSLILSTFGQTHETPGTSSILELFKNGTILLSLLFEHGSSLFSGN